MKKTVLIILAALAIVALAFSVFLCLMGGNTEATSKGNKFYDNLSTLSYGEELRQPTAFTNIKILFNGNKLTSFIKIFDPAENFQFPMRTGAAFMLSTVSAISCILFPALVIFLAVMAFLKKTVLSLKTLIIASAIGSVFTILPYTVSLVLLQLVYETATFKFNIINIYLALAIVVVYAIAAIVTMHMLKVSDDHKVNVMLSEKAFASANADESN